MNASDLIHVEYALVHMPEQVRVGVFSPFDQFLLTVLQSLVAQVVPVDDNTNTWLIIKLKTNKGYFHAKQKVQKYKK